ncbi:hypothetical protein [Stenotrophomonas maltophilia]|uniref:hypothetical protein n=1 Tax=Stenotrophomonas maltophilia TaxID=40324 RepID=UPI000C151310|nr:hypothetical protein [Stenotrophomonas maltophilia]
MSAAIECNGEDGRQLYERVAARKVDESIIVHAIDEACQSSDLLGDCDEIVDRLQDDDHAQVLMKDATDAVVLVTGALEARSHTVYRDMVIYAEQQASFEPFDDVSTAVRVVLARNMAETALEDMDSGPVRALALTNLRFGLSVLGDSAPFHADEFAEREAG